MYNRGKINLTCTVCGRQYETNGRDLRQELRGQGWSVDSGTITCKRHADLKWPATRHRGLANSPAPSKRAARKARRRARG